MATDFKPSAVGTANSSAQAKELNRYLTREELAQARACSALIAPQLAAHHARRLRELRHEFQDRPKHVEQAKKWVTALPPDRLKMFGALAAYEAADLVMPAADDSETNWQTGVAIVSAYAGSLTGRQSGLVMRLLTLHATAMQRCQGVVRVLNTDPESDTVGTMPMLPAARGKDGTTVGRRRRRRVDPDLTDSSPPTPA